MKHTIHTLRGLTLLTVGSILGLCANPALCQTTGRKANCPTSSSSQTSAGSTTTTGTTTAATISSATQTAATASLYQNYVSRLSAQLNPLSAQSVTSRNSAQTGVQTASTFSVQRAASNNLLVQWSGDTSNVQRVNVAVLDAGGQVLEQKAITQSPVQAQFTLTDTAANYGIQIVNANGASRTYYAPIPASGQASSTVSAQRTNASSLLVQWSGDTSNVQKVNLAVFDANDQMLSEKTVTQSPVQASLALTNGAHHYGIQVVYTDGTTTTYYEPIR